MDGKLHPQPKGASQKRELLLSALKGLMTKAKAHRVSTLKRAGLFMAAQNPALKALG
jgi:hypothetical protein